MSKADDDNEYKLEITDVSLFVKTAILNEKLYKSITERIKKEPARLLLRRVQLAYRIIPKGVNNYIITYETYDCYLKLKLIR